MPILFHDGQIRSGLRQRRNLRRFLEEKIRNLHPQAKTHRIQFVFCSDEQLLALNRQFLGHEDLTDILSFDLSERPDHLEAEIHISIERVRDNALQLSLPYEQELHRVLFHGILHLIGYGDKTAAEQKIMRAAEDQWLKEYYGRQKQ